jgi:hypothetical protein
MSHTHIATLSMHCDGGLAYQEVHEGRVHEEGASRDL